MSFEVVQLAGENARLILQNQRSEEVKERLLSLIQSSGDEELIKKSVGIQKREYLNEQN